MSSQKSLDTLAIEKRIKLLLWFFISCLLLSGLTAFPLVYEINMLLNIVGPETQLGRSWPAMAEWISFVNSGIIATNKHYPFIFYGTDWLAFAHIVIAIAFIGPLRDPVKNIWVIEFAMIACVLIIPLAMIAGSIRGIPFFWRLIDCSFGIFGIIPLWYTRVLVKRLESC